MADTPVCKRYAFLETATRFRTADGGEEFRLDFLAPGSPCPECGSWDHRSMSDVRTTIWMTQEKMQNASKRLYIMAALPLKVQSGEK
jgi:hypothetical protein